MTWRYVEIMMRWDMERVFSRLSLTLVVYSRATLCLAFPLSANRFHLCVLVHLYVPVHARAPGATYDGVRSSLFVAPQWRLLHLWRTLTWHARVFRGPVLPRQTREAANATLLCMLKANRRAFQPLMQALMGAWWCSQADTATEVSVSIHTT